MAFTQKNRDIV